MKQALLNVIDQLHQAPALPLDTGEPFVASGRDSGLPGATSILIYSGPGNDTQDMIVYQDLIEEIVEPILSRPCRYLGNNTCHGLFLILLRISREAKQVGGKPGIYFFFEFKLFLP